MELVSGNKKFEALNEELNNPEQLEAYKKPYDDRHILLTPRLLGALLVGIGNLVYGKAPSYLKFRAIEVIARIPYQSWSSAVFTLLTVFYTDEERAKKLSKLNRYARHSLDNETMHVVVISQLTNHYKKAGFIRYTAIPFFFAFFYFWATYTLYLIRPRWSLELNYLFEQHAFEQYSKFLEDNEETLRTEPVRSDFLTWYGRYPRSQYEFFQSVRNDEIIHRNQSIRQIKAERDAAHVLFWKITLPIILLLVIIFIFVYFMPVSLPDFF